jgi:hypothetical protein
MKEKEGRKEGREGGREEGTEEGKHSRDLARKDCSSRL